MQVHDVLYTSPYGFSYIHRYNNGSQCVCVFFFFLFVWYFFHLYVECMSMVVHTNNKIHLFKRNEWVGNYMHKMFKCICGCIIIVQMFICVYMNVYLFVWKMIVSLFATNCIQYRLELLLVVRCLLEIEEKLRRFGPTLVSSYYYYYWYSWNSHCGQNRDQTLTKFKLSNRCP